MRWVVYILGLTALLLFASCAIGRADRRDLEQAISVAREEIMARIPELDPASRLMVATNPPARVSYYPSVRGAAQYGVYWIISSNRFVVIGGRGNMAMMEGAHTSIRSLNSETKRLFSVK